jgi:tellurite methyltransferase
MIGMTGSHRDYWNQRYIERPWPEEPSPWLVANADVLPKPGHALDAAGGTGRNAVWLARRGWDVTIVDVSDVALSFATERAEAIHVELHTSLRDLRDEPLPEGPWDLILLFHYLDRELFPALASALEPGGLLIGALATVANLERNERPALPYLIEEAELPALIGDFEIVRYEEGWQDDRHNARFVAQRRQ